MWYLRRTLMLSLALPPALGLFPQVAAAQQEGSAEYELIYRGSLTYPLTYGPFLVVDPDFRPGRASMIGTARFSSTPTRTESAAGPAQAKSRRLHWEGPTIVWLRSRRTARSSSLSGATTSTSWAIRPRSICMTSKREKISR